MLKKNAKQLLSYFIRGLLLLAPLFLTLYVLYQAVAWVDGLLNITFPVHTDLARNSVKHIRIPGFGLLVVVLGTTVIGFFATYLITEPIKVFFTKTANRVPLFKLIYTSIKDFMEAFVGKEKKFTQAVLVVMNDEGFKKIGFITQKDLSSLGQAGHVGVYLPYSYSVLGEFWIVPKGRVSPLNLPAGQAMKFVVSGGVSDL